MAVRVVVADDSVLLREGIVRMLREEGFDVCGQAGDAGELVRLVEETRPDVAIVDIRMPPNLRDEGILATEAIRRLHGDAVGVLVLSQYLEPDFAMRLLDEGGRGAGGGSVIDHAIVAQLLARRRHRDPLEELTAREREVLALMAEGLSNQAIAGRLGLSEKTVESYTGAIFGKLALEPAPDLHRRVLAVLTFLQAR
jgi:DNA-binding NarL/FixJ family response regulator